MNRDPLQVLTHLPEGAVVALVGAPRTGKSRLAKAAAPRWRRRAVYEPHGARDRLEERRGRRLYPWSGRLVSAPELVARPRLLDRDPLALVVVPSSTDRIRMGLEFSCVARMCWFTGGLHVVGEEAGLYSRDAVEVSNLLASGAGHADLRLVLIAQSWTRLTIDLRRNVSIVVAWAQSEPADVVELARKCGRAFADDVRRLRGPPNPDPPRLWCQGDT